MKAMNAMARCTAIEARDTKRSLTSDALTPGAAQPLHPVETEMGVS